MKYGIIRLLYYYGYNSRKTYFGTSFFYLRSELFWGGSQFSEETRSARAWIVQSARVQVPTLYCVTLDKSLYLSEPVSMLKKEGNASLAGLLWDNVHEFVVWIAKCNISIIKLQVLLIENMIKPHSSCFLTLSPLPRFPGKC